MPQNGIVCSNSAKYPGVKIALGLFGLWLGFSVHMGVSYAQDCPDGVCEVSENCVTCPEDCGSCTGDCCLDHGGVGCGVEECQTCVCDIDPFCCETAWDALCAGEAFEQCDTQCDCINSPGLSNCCVANFGPGCNNAACQSCVCKKDSYCCSVSWDFACLECAEGGPGFGNACLNSGCENQCMCLGCGNGTCADDETCATCAADCGPCLGECCQNHGDPGCDDVECRTCVCGGDSYCCDIAWDGACVAAVFDNCVGSCACTGLVGTGSCCDSKGSAGCADGACQSCVCSLDAYCCSTSWDDACVDCAEGGTGFEEACVDGSCHELCGCLACGDGVCAGAESCADCALDCGLCIDDCCVSHGQPGCVDGGCAACVCAADAFCCEIGWDTACVGSVWANCTALCGCTQFVGEGSCCSVQTDAGCIDGACQGCVCALDSFCCDVSWDTACVECAEGGSGFLGACEGGACLDICGCVACGDGACNGPEGCDNCPKDCGFCANDCCVDHGTQGCSDTVCADCVCELDPFCCEMAWDSQCVGEVFADCADTCPCTEVVSEASCCTAHDGVGCSNIACQACVCSVDAYCCSVAWDIACVDCAEGGAGFEGACGGSDCGTACVCVGCGNSICDGGENCATCPGDCGGCPGGCCEPQDGVGCDDGSCVDCVCAVDEYCCGVAWDTTCVDQVYAACGNSCACTQGVGTGSCCEVQPAAGCGDPQCQSCVCALDSFCCTIAWDFACVECTGDGPGFDNLCLETTCVVECGCQPCGDGVCDAASGEDCESCPSDCGECPFFCPSADLNQNGLVNVTDVQCSILATLGGGGVPSCLVSGNLDDADLDCDGDVTVTDIILTIQGALGQPLSPELDQNENGCVDACDP